jgi:cytochrome c oxidase assembly protein subunit 15
MRAFQVFETGGPEGMRLVEVPDPVAGEGRLLVEVSTCGVNYIDTYHRAGTYAREVPFGLGLEGVGVVRELGPGVGGFTVLMGLAWWTVSVHFLVSMVLVWLAVLLVHTAGTNTAVTHPAGGDSAPATDRPAPPHIRRLVMICTLVLAALLTAGTMVTAAGPHAGDSKTPRLDIAVPTLAQVHADLLFCFVGLLVGLGFALHAVRASRPVQLRFRILVATVVAQGVLGGAQYALGVPETLVSLHVLGACLVTAATAAVWAATVAPRPAPAPTADAATIRGE